MQSISQEILQAWREDFEAHRAKHGGNPKTKRDPLNGEYSTREVRAAWINWVSARQSLTIDLPDADADAYFDHFFDGEVSMREKCKRSIEAQGFCVATKSK